MNNKKPFTFDIVSKLEPRDGRGELGRAATYHTPHGPVHTPCFVTVGTKATVKGLTPEMVDTLGAQVFLANTYHLHLSPGEETVEGAGGLHAFSNWSGPMMTDSGGFQAFSLGAAFGTTVSKIAKADSGFVQTAKNPVKESMAKISEDGVSFRSIKDGSQVFFTPEKSMQIQQKLGADMYFAFDECTSPQASYEYQIEAMNRTHRWAQRCVDEHTRLEQEKLSGDQVKHPQALFGVVQGGRHLDLREASARTLAEMGFDGFGIGGSFDKDDMEGAVYTACKHLPEDKPRHLLGIGEVLDFFLGVENGIDTFDCVAPTRMARHGGVHTKDGKINITRASCRTDFTPIEPDCGCYACQNYTKAYICHMLREKEMFGATLASIHNLYFVTHLVDDIRQAMIDGVYWEFKEQYLARYMGNTSE